MATIGLKDLYIATHVKGSDGKPSYGTPERAAKAITAELSVEVAAAELYADDALAESVKEFSKGTIKLNVDDLSPEMQAKLLGHTMSEDNVIYAKDTDEPPYVAVGFRARKTGGNYRYIWLYRVKFELPSDSFQTKQDGIEFKTPELTGTFEKRADGLWKADYVGNEADGVGKTWFNSVKEPTVSA